jgi:hypothetical protein
MSRPCTICSLPDQRRRKVERQLMAENNTAVSVATGLSRFALARHRKHMGAAMAAAYFAAPQEEREKAMVAYGTDLQAEVRALIDEANQLRATAVRERDVRTALKGIDTALKALEMFARLSGQLQGPQHNHLHLHAEVPSREEAIEAARECLEVFAPHLLATEAVSIDIDPPSKGELPGESNGIGEEPLHAEATNGELE